MIPIENKIVVSISCITYNHAKYLRECFEGFLLQKTDFKFEILVHDDASTDGTREIIEEYTKNYPHLFFPIIQTENQYAKGVRGMNKYNVLRAKGKYIALCEGDDYWIDPLKLQKEVDFLEANRDCSMVFSNAKVLIESDGSNSNITRGLIEIKESRVFTSQEILENWIIPTASVLFRFHDVIHGYNEIASNKNFMFGDTILFLFLSTKGKIYGMKDFMVAYRRHAQGATNIPIDINYYRKDYIHTREVIKLFGRNLETKKIRRKLSDYALSLGIDQLVKGNVKDGFQYLYSSIKYDHNFLKRYILQKIKLK